MNKGESYNDDNLTGLPVSVLHFIPISSMTKKPYFNMQIMPFIMQKKKAEATTKFTKTNWCLTPIMDKCLFVVSGTI
jgi:hypothetical protein